MAEMTAEHYQDPTDPHECICGYPWPCAVRALEDRDATIVALTAELERVRGEKDAAQNRATDLRMGLFKVHTLSTKPSNGWMMGETFTALAAINHVTTKAIRETANPVPPDQRGAAETEGEPTEGILPGGIPFEVDPSMPDGVIGFRDRATGAEQRFAVDGGPVGPRPVAKNRTRRLTP